MKSLCLTGFEDVFSLRSEQFAVESQWCRSNDDNTQFPRQHSNLSTSLLQLHSKRQTRYAVVISRHKHCAPAVFVLVGKYFPDMGIKPIRRLDRKHAEPC